MNVIGLHPAVLAERVVLGVLVVVVSRGVGADEPAKLRRMSEGRVTKWRVNEDPSEQASSNKDLVEI